MKLTAIRVSSQSPISHTKSTLCSVHKDSPVAETFNTLTSFPFPLFCRTSLCITDLNQERDYLGETDPVEGQFLVTHLLYRVYPCSAQKDSPVAKTINTLTAFPFPLFCGT